MIMNNTVILFLTSASTWDRTQMCVSNFKQLEKLGYDIITLTTSDSLPDYIYKKSKMVVHDYEDQKCDKKNYYQHFKKTGSGYFFSSCHGGHQIVFYPQTNFPSVLRNTRTLIEVAKSFGYEKYFYIEDDHFIDERDFNVVTDNIKLLDTNDLVIYSFDQYGGGDRDINKGYVVFCSYLHFGKCDSMSSISKNFAYTSFEFNSNPNLYLHFYESMFKTVINIYKPTEFKYFVPDEVITDVFKNSKMNMIYSFSNPADDCRCNIVRNTVTNKNVFYYHTDGLKNEVNLKLFINKILLVDRAMGASTWFCIDIGDEDINGTEVIIDNKFFKSFKNLNINDINYNGEIFY